MRKELVRKSDGYIAFTLGNFHETDTEYIVYDGADYVGFSKAEYSLVDITDMKIECECGKKAVYIQDEKFEALGWYRFDCECGEGYLVPKNSPLIELEIGGYAYEISNHN